jgi:hypothetical protein
VPILDPAMTARSSLSRLLALALAIAAVAGLAAYGIPDANAARRCGFHPSSLRTITHRHHVSCAEAKRVLLRLKGRRDTIPMVCGKPRRIDGWRVENVERSLSSVMNRYSRGSVSFHYRRYQNANRIYCPPEHRSSEHV